jgi:hypothetical protein
MINELTLAIPYYNASNLIPIQLECWNSYSVEVKQKLKIVLVDDCSNNEHKLVNVFPKETDLNIEIYEVMDDLPWNDGGASNLSVFVAQTEWVIRTDMDYIVPNSTMEYILNNTFDSKMYYTMEAKYYHNKQSIEIHPSTLLITKKLFFDAGAYDEDFTGNHGWTDVNFRDRLDRISKYQHITNIWIEGVLGGSNHALPRNADGINHKILLKKKKEGLPIPTSHLRFKWKKVDL